MTLNEARAKESESKHQIYKYRAAYSDKRKERKNSRIECFLLATPWRQITTNYKTQPKLDIKAASGGKSAQSKHLYHFDGSDLKFGSRCPATVHLDK